MAFLTLGVADFLPDIELPLAETGVPVRLRQSVGRTTVLITVHSAECAGCREYVKDLARISGEFDIWDGRLLVIVPGDIAEAAGMRSPFGKVLSDERQELAGPESAAVIVADRYDQVFAVSRSGARHDLPSPRELEEWLKFLGTLCPE